MDDVTACILLFGGASEVHLQVNVNGSARVPARIQRREFCEPFVIRHLDTAQEARWIDLASAASTRPARSAAATEAWRRHVTAATTAELRRRPPRSSTPSAGVTIGAHCSE